MQTWWPLTIPIFSQKIPSLHKLRAKETNKNYQSRRILTSRSQASCKNNSKFSKLWTRSKIISFITSSKSTNETAPSLRPPIKQSRVEWWRFKTNASQNVQLKLINVATLVSISEDSNSCHGNGKWFKTYHCAGKPKWTPLSAHLHI